MRALLLDTETTGLDVTKDRVLEIGAVIYDLVAKQPLHIYSALVHPSVEFAPSPLAAGYVSPTGLRAEWVEEFGVSFGEAFGAVERMAAKHKAEVLIGHNVQGYDLAILRHEFERDPGNGTFSPLFNLPVIDTRHDLPFEKEPTSRRLVHLSAEHGFINPFEHRAIFDALASAKLLGEYDLEKVLALSKQPWVTLRACVSYDDRQKAKDARFMWEEAGGKRFEKAWVKQVRESAVEREIQQGSEKGFRVIKV